MKKHWVLAAAVLISFLPFALAEQSPEAYKNQADVAAQTGMQLQQQAMQMLQSPEMTREKLSATVDLYVRAGQQFEQAGKIYQALSSQYPSSAQDAQNAFQAMQACMGMIQKIKNEVSGKPNV